METRTAVNLNLNDKNSKGIGYALIGLAILWFIYWWVHLLTHVQTVAIDNIKQYGHPHLFVAGTVGAWLAGFLAGVLFGALTYMGAQFISLWWKPYGTWDQIKWHDLLSFKALYLWVGLAGILFALFTHLWQHDL